uniref:efflux RND transporter periplasmic adaptor subunit n=1 Tax=Shumkonia mesophila TaxID=2838854 RepID=UPI0029352C44|nr:efflux RND transporter periplasmic adaptor subunit [Shumkonia mesophila]
MNTPDGIGTIVQEISPPLPRAAPMSRRRLPRVRGRWLALVVFLSLAGASGTAWWSARGPAPVSYVTMPITRGPVVRTVTASGTVNPELTVLVGTYVSGVIQQLNCDYNTKVVAGQVCAKIDPRPYQTAVDQDRANVAVARAQFEKDQANLTYAKRDFERKQMLVARQSVSQDAADMAKNAYDQAVAQIALDRATIAQRQAALDAAIVNLGYTDIVSPVDGTVVSRNVTQGQTVAASFQTPTLFLIATDLTRMQVDTNVSESDIGDIKEGDKATFTVDAFPNRIFAGRVIQVRQSPQTVQNVVTYDAVIGVGNRDYALKPGMTASMHIVVEQKDDVLRVPNQALRYAPSAPTDAAATKVAAAGSGETAALWILRDRRPVRLSVVRGLADEAFTEIAEGGLGPGDPVVVGEESGPDRGR